MVSFNELQQKFGKALYDLDSARKRSIYLTIIGWSLFMIFIMAITAMIIIGFINPALYSIAWTSSIQWLINLLPDGFPPQIIIIGVFILLSYGSSILLQRSFNAEHKYTIKVNKLLKKIIAYTLPDFKQDYKITITQQEVKESKLFSYLEKDRAINNVSIQHTISKKYENTELKIADISVQGSLKKSTTSFLMSLPYFNQFILSYKLLKTSISKKNMIDELKNDSYKGIFVTATFNKSLSGHTLVFPDKLQQSIGDFAQKIQSLNFKKEELVKLENPEFEKQFKVYSTSQVEARYALTPHMMEQLVLLQSKISKPIMLSFHKSAFNIAVLQTNGLISLNRADVLNDQLLKEIYNQLTAISTIVDNLNLNLNIWRK